jgi:hypothetical protein
VHRFMLRLAYLVAKHGIPKELVVNGDHTGVPLPARHLPRTRCHPMRPEIAPRSPCPEILTPNPNQV